MTHTRGPWKVTADKPRLADNPRLIVEDDIGNPVCAMSLRGVYGDTVKMTANAHLIAAAPEMYIALQNVRVELDSYPHCPFCGSVHGEGHEKDCIGYEVEAAIRKARGEE